jgi:glycosyltransferase involved in cell wall biosynthesis
MFRDKYPNVPLTFDLYQSLKQSDFANALGVHKFFLTLSPVEGFGLPALEAMAAGCAVIGFDAWGGRDYFRHDINCMVAPYPKLETIVDYLYVLICDDEKARSLAATALVDARRFDQRAFDIEWLKVFESIIHG